jgi:inhibitor of cysteine peptidase
METKMFERIVKILFFVSVVALLAACGARDMSVGRDKNGGKVDLTTGETLVISLDSNPTTGYSWEIQETDATLLNLKGYPEFVQQPNNGALVVGAGGTQVFRFEALKTGSTTLTLVYHRPFEKNVAPVDTYSLTVNIK